jgi:hypothetical protein
VEVVAPPPRGFRRGDYWLAAAALVGGALFFASLGRLWPLAQADLTIPPAEVRSKAAAFLASRGNRLDGFESASRLTVDDAALDYLERAFGRDAAQARIASGLPVVAYRVTFKRAGDPDAWTVVLDGRGTAVGWSREMQEDGPGPRVAADSARSIALSALTRDLRLDPAEWIEKAASAREFPNRRDHSFLWERTLSETPELRERVQVVVSGADVSLATRSVVVPAQAVREATAREAPGRGLAAVGIALAGIAAAAAFWVWLRGLSAGATRLGRVIALVAVVAVLQSVTAVLQQSRLFAAWETLWPRWVSDMQVLSYDVGNLVWMLAILLAFIGAGEMLDRQSGAGRGESLWALSRGEFGHPRVAAASVRGFLLGLVCAGVLAGSVLLLERFAGASTAIQPRGFFFYSLNSSAPSLATLSFFLGVALAEELGYRFFGGTWLLSLTQRRWIAVVVPGILYGLTHTMMDFLPPAEPFWARPLVLSLVGCVWGWAFFRYDALTVVLSHFAADLFIFNWPRLASGRFAPTASSLLVFLVPLIPALLGAAAVWRRRRQPAIREAA